MRIHGWSRSALAILLVLAGVVALPPTKSLEQQKLLHFSISVVILNE